MLQLPADAVAPPSEGDGDQPSTIRFGYNRSSERSDGQGSSTSTPKNSGLVFGSDESEQLKALEEGCAALGVQVVVLLKSLRSAICEASEVTKENLKVYNSLCTEVDQVADADLAGATALIERTLALSLELQDIEAVKSKVQGLERAVQSFEQTADKLIRRGHR